MSELQTIDTSKNVTDDSIKDALAIKEFTVNIARNYLSENRRINFR